MRAAARPAGPFTGESEAAATAAVAAAAAAAAVGEEEEGGTAEEGGGARYGYDVVVCGEVGADLPASPAALTAALESLAALLAPHGMLVLAQSAADVSSGALHEALQAARVQVQVQVQQSRRPTPGGEGEGGRCSGTAGTRRLHSVALPAPDGDGGLVTLAMVSEDRGDSSATE